MVVIRMSRTGRPHLQIFRIVAADRRSPRDGKVLEILGTYDPRAEKLDDKFRFKEDRIRHWISKGARPSDRVWNMLRKKGINKINTKAGAAKAATA